MVSNNLHHSVSDMLNIGMPEAQEGSGKRMRKQLMMEAEELEKRLNDCKRINAKNKIAEFKEQKEMPDRNSMRAPLEDNEMEDLLAQISARKKQRERDAMSSPEPKKYVYGSYKDQAERDAKKSGSSRTDRAQREISEEREAFYSQQSRSKYKFNTQALLHESDTEDTPCFGRKKKDEAGELLERKVRRLERPKGSRYVYRNQHLEYTDDEDEEHYEPPKESRFLKKNSKGEIDFKREEKEDDPDFYRYLFKYGAEYSGLSATAKKVLTRKSPDEEEEENSYHRPAYNGTRKKQESPKQKEKTNKMWDDSEDEDDLFLRSSLTKKKYDNFKSEDVEEDHFHRSSLSKKKYNSSRREESEVHMNGMSRRVNRDDISDDEGSIYRRPAAARYESPAASRYESPAAAARYKSPAPPLYETYQPDDREKRNGVNHDEEKKSTNKWKEELAKFKSYKPKRSIERFKKQHISQPLTNPIGYRIAKKQDQSYRDSSVSFRPEKELTYRYGSYKMVGK